MGWSPALNRDVAPKATAIGAPMMNSTTKINTNAAIMPSSPPFSPFAAHKAPHIPYKLHQG